VVQSFQLFQDGQELKECDGIERFKRGFENKVIDFRGWFNIIDAIGVIKRRKEMGFTGIF
jgi:hypothetical protein